MRAAVYLIGTGPGAPDLISVRGLRCLQSADVVLYDNWVHARLLEAAPASAERIDVGSASPQPMAQEAICYLLAEKARERKVVVRLKWGDPFVFDRSGAEALFLHEQGIRFEVIPGVPAAIGVAAYAGIPLTYPGGGDTVTLVRGHEDEGRERVRVDWTSLARLEGTVVCYAGPRQLPKMLDAMVTHGRAPEEAAALVINGTLSRQHTIASTLGELLRLVHDTPLEQPALLVVGKVVGLRDHLRWFDAQPLFGRRVLVTSSLEQAGDLIDALEGHGAEAVRAPLIRIAAPTDAGPLDRACEHIGEYNWVVFASPNGVHAFFNRLLKGHRDLRALGRASVCAVGPGTAARLARFGVATDVLPEDHRPLGVVAALGASRPLGAARALMPSAEGAPNTLAETLRRAGMRVDEVDAYRTSRAESPVHLDVYRQLLDGRIDAVTFSSASAVRAFTEIYGPDQAADLLSRTIVATLGPATAEAALAARMTPAIQLAGGTMTALVDAIAARIARA